MIRADAQNRRSEMTAKLISIANLTGRTLRLAYGGGVREIPPDGATLVRETAGSPLIRKRENLPPPKAAAAGRRPERIGRRDAEIRDAVRELPQMDGVDGNRYAVVDPATAASIECPAARSRALMPDATPMGIAFTALAREPELSVTGFAVVPDPA